MLIVDILLKNNCQKKVFAIQRLNGRSNEYAPLTLRSIDIVNTYILRRQAHGVEF